MTPPRDDTPPPHGAPGPGDPGRACAGCRATAASDGARVCGTFRDADEPGCRATASPGGTRAYGTFRAAAGRREVTKGPPRRSEPPGEEDARVGAVLRMLAAAARGGPVDPAREQAAVAAFRAAHTARSVRDRRRPAGPARSLRALAGGLVVVFAIGGVAVAAGTGVLPLRGAGVHAGPEISRATRTAQPPPSGALPRPGTPSASGRDTPRATPRGAVPPPAATGRPGPWPPRTGHPGADVTALCRTYLAAVRQGERPERRVTDRLEREAGLPRRVAAYCRALLSTGPGPSRTTTAAPRRPDAARTPGAGPRPTPK